MQDSRSFLQDSFNFFCLGPILDSSSSSLSISIFILLCLAFSNSTFFSRFTFRSFTFSSNHILFLSPVLHCSHSYSSGSQSSSSIFPSHLRCILHSLQQEKLSSHSLVSSHGKIIHISASQSFFFIFLFFLTDS